MKNKINKNLVRMLLVLTLFASPFVLATDGIGVGAPYWDEYPLLMYPGENATVNMNLQTTSESPSSFKANITSDGNGIATLNDPDLVYKVESGKKTYVPITIKIPSDTVYGDTRMIRIIFTQVSEEEGGMLILQTAVEGKFPVEIVGEKESTLYNKPQVQENNYIWYWIIAIIILLIIIISIILKKKSNNL